MSAPAPTIRRAQVPSPGHAVDLVLRFLAPLGAMGHFLIDKIERHEGIDAIIALADRIREQSLYCECILSPRTPPPTSALLSVGLTYGPPDGPRVIDLHFVRAHVERAQSVPVSVWLVAIASACRHADTHKQWIYAATTRGVFRRIARRWPQLGFELLGTYQHVNGRQYDMFIRPPC